MESTTNVIKSDSSSLKGTQSENLKAIWLEMLKIMLGKKAVLKWKRHVFYMMYLLIPGILFYPSDVFPFYEVAQRQGSWFKNILIMWLDV